jgi:hypothetical protein
MSRGKQFDEAVVKVLQNGPLTTRYQYRLAALLFPRLESGSMCSHGKEGLEWHHELRTAQKRLRIAGVIERLHVAKRNDLWRLAS